MTSSAEMNDRLRRARTTRPAQEPAQEPSSGGDGIQAPTNGSALVRAAMDAARARRRRR